MKKLLLVLGVIVVGVGGVWSLSKTQSPQVPRVAEENVEQNQAPQEVVEIQASEDGITAFDLLKANTQQVDFDQYDAGVFITTIDGLAGDSGHYWAIYLNDEYATTSADKIFLQAGDKVTFKYEEVDAAQF